MIRSSRGVRLDIFFDSTSTPSSSSSASSSSVNSPTRGLRLHAGKECDAFGHFLFPRVSRRDRRQPAPFLLELQGPLGKLARLLDRETGAFAGDHGMNL